MTNVIQYMMRKEWKFQRLNSELFNENQRLGYPNYLKLDKFTNMIFKNLFKLNFNPKNWLLLIGTINLFWMNWRIFDDIFVLLIHTFYWYLPWIKVRKRGFFENFCEWKIQNLWANAYLSVFSLKLLLLVNWHFVIINLCIIYMHY